MNQTHNGANLGFEQQPATETVLEQAEVLCQASVQV